MGADLRTIAAAVVACPRFVWAPGMLGTPTWGVSLDLSDPATQGILLASFGRGEAIALARGDMAVAEWTRHDGTIARFEEWPTDHGGSMDAAVGVALGKALLACWGAP